MFRHLKLPNLLILLLFAIFSIQTKATVRLYTTGQLTSNLITSIQKDHRGYVWIATEYGLNRFDGIHFRHYLADGNPHSLKDNLVWRLFIDRSNSLWIVSANYVQLYDEKTGGFITIDKFFNSLKSMYQTSDGRLYVADSENGFFLIDPVSMKACPAVRLNKVIGSGVNTAGMYQDRTGLLWIWTDGNGVMCYSPKTGKLRRFGNDEIKNTYITSVMEDKFGHLFVVGSSNIYYYDRSNGHFSKVADDYGCDPNYRCAGTGTDGRLVTGAYGGGLFHLDAHRILHHVTSSELTSIHIGCSKITAYTSSGTDEWMGCYQAGLLYATSEKASFDYFPLTLSSKNDEYTTFKSNGESLTLLYPDPHSGNIWVGQMYGGIVLLDDNHQQMRHILNGQSVVSLFEDKDGTMYAGTYAHGLIKVGSDGSGVSLGFANDRIKSIVRSPLSPDLFVADMDKGLYRFNTMTNKATLLPGLTNAHINAIKVDQVGRLWIAHYNGVDVYNPRTGKFSRILDSRGWMNNLICYSLTIAHDGSIWMATNNCLWRLRRKKNFYMFYHYTVKNGIPSDMVCAVEEDNHGKIWVSTYGGLCRIDPASGATLHSIIPYRVDDGLLFVNYSRSISARTRYGVIVFGKDYGLTFFNPKRQVNLRGEKSVQLTDINIYGFDNIDCPWGDDVALEDARKLTFDYDHNTFSLVFSTMSYHADDAGILEYRINKGPWTNLAGSTDFVSFTRMEPGSYKLEVRSSDSGNYSPVSEWTIRILPPWYLSWCAYLIYMLIAAAIVYVLWRGYKKRQIADENERRIQFYVDISHELRSPLTLIMSSLSSLMKRKFDEPAMRALRHTKINTDRLLALTNQILSICKIEKGQMHLHRKPVEIVHYIREVIDNYSYIAEKRGIQLEVKTTSPDDTFWSNIDPEWFDKVICNLVGNALKYVIDQTGEIIIILQVKDCMLDIAVTDNGEGINESQLDRIFHRFYQVENRVGAGMMGYGIGLNLTYKIVTMHGGHITASNRTDGVRGSRFLIEIPYIKDYAPAAVESQSENTVSENDELPLKTVGKTFDSKMASLHLCRRKTNYSLVFVDDDEGLCNFISTELSKSYKVTTYSNGKDALPRIIEDQPDIVVSDVLMPVMDGFHLCRQLKQNTVTSHIPVIMLTTKSDFESRMEGLDKGADAYVDKPFNIEELEAIIASTIENRRRLRGKFSGIQEQKDTVTKVELKGNDEQLMERIMKAVNDNLTDSEFNVEELARKVGLSRVQLYRRIKEITGMPAGDFIRGLRMQEAARLFNKGDIAVSQVAYAVGFSSPNNFSVAFKKYFGTSPFVYLKEKQGKKSNETK